LAKRIRTEAIHVMRTKKRKKMLFVYNPYSGKGEIGMALSDILWRFTVSGYDVTVHPTSAAKDGEVFISQHAGEYDMVVTSGGDGMLHELFAGVIESDKDVCCGYIPTGTVNDFASSLMISTNPIEAAETIVNGKFKQIDAGVFNGSVFSYVAAFGLFTDVSYSTDQGMKNILGVAAYFIEILKSMEPKRIAEASVHAVVRMDDKEYEDDFIFGFAGNTLSVGGMTNIVPDGALMNDGLLDCLFVRTPSSFVELDRIRQAILMGKQDVPDIVSSKVRTVEVISEKEIAWTLDGEYGGNTDHAIIGIRDRAIKIAVP
jgi:YegS/Rv2252/BmrU family lipid kinase